MRTLALEPVLAPRLQRILDPPAVDPLRYSCSETPERAGWSHRFCHQVQLNSGFVSANAPTSRGNGSRSYRLTLPRINISPCLQRRSPSSSERTSLDRNPSLACKSKMAWSRRPVAVLSSGTSRIRSTSAPVSVLGMPGETNAAPSEPRSTATRWTCNRQTDYLQPWLRVPNGLTNPPWR